MHIISKIIAVISAFVLFSSFGFITQDVVASQEEDLFVKEYKIKTALLYNFFKFVEWPSEAFTDPGSPMICYILGKEPYDTALEKIGERTVRDRKLVVRRIENINDIGTCHAIYVCASEKEHLGDILEIVKGRNILTVGGMEKFGELGGMINFFKDGKKVRFEINPDAALEADLKISSQLLALSKIVRRKYGEER